MARILVIDDSPVIRDLLEDLLAEDGHDVVVMSSGADGIKAAGEESFDLCICDMHMPKMDGVEVLRGIQKVRPELKFLFTDSLPDNLAEQVQELGNYICVKKPFELSQLRDILKSLLKAVKVQ